MISVYNTDSSYGVVLYKSKYQKLYYHSALIKMPTLPFDIMTWKSALREELFKLNWWDLTFGIFIVFSDWSNMISS